MRARRTLFAIAAGAALQYFLDPERGADRRNRAREQVEPALRRGQQRVEEARSDQQSPSSDSDLSDRLSTNAATSGLASSDMAPSGTTGTGYSGTTGTGYSGTTGTGYGGTTGTDYDDTGLATPITPSEDLSGAGLSDTGLASPATDLDDLSATDVTVTEVIVTDSDLGAETPYADPTDTYTGTDDTFTSAADTYTGSDAPSADTDVIDTYPPTQGQVTGDADTYGVPADDYQLADRVRSQVLGRDEFQSAVVNLDAINGVVTLRGELDTATADDLEQAVRQVDGVLDVISYLHSPGTVAPNEEDVRE